MKNKEDLFRSLSSHHHALALAQFIAALAVKGSVEETLRSALIAKDGDMVSIIHGSPHGEELLDINFRTAPILSAYSVAVHSLLTDWIDGDGGGATIPAQALARIILDAAHGQKTASTSIRDY